MSDEYNPRLFCQWHGVAGPACGCLRNCQKVFLAEIRNMNQPMRNKKPPKDVNVVERS